MSPKAPAVRIEPTLRALEHLSGILKRPMNELVNEAPRDFVARRSREVEQDLKATLTRLARIVSAILISRKPSPVSWTQKLNTAMTIPPKAKWCAANSLMAR